MAKKNLRLLGATILVLGLSSACDDSNPKRSGPSVGPETGTPADNSTESEAERQKREKEEKEAAEAAEAQRKKCQDNPTATGCSGATTPTQPGSQDPNQLPTNGQVKTPVPILCTGEENENCQNGIRVSSADTRSNTNSTSRADNEDSKGFRYFQASSATFFLSRSGVNKNCFLPESSTIKVHKTKMRQVTENQSLYEIEATSILDTFKVQPCRFNQGFIFKSSFTAGTVEEN